MRFSRFGVMMTKTKVIALTVALCLVGAVTAFALVYHIDDAAEALKAEYKDRIDEYKSEKDFKIRNDVSHLTQQEIERMRTETEDYLQMRLGADYQDALNEKSNEIRKVTDEKIEELKRFIDTELAE